MLNVERCNLLMKNIQCWQN